MAGSVLKLNVGGAKFQTSLSTLTLVEPESMLARMVEQDREARMIQNGEEIFIDRDGELFKYILDYMRNPASDSPWGSEDPILVKRLKIEADFFGVLGLRRKIEEACFSPFAPGDLVQFKPGVMEVINKYCQVNMNRFSSPLRDRSFVNFPVLELESPHIIVKAVSPPGNAVKFTYPLDLECLTGRVVERVEGRPGCVVHFQLGGDGRWVDHKWEIHNAHLCRA